MDISVTLHKGTLQPKFEGYELRKYGILVYRHRLCVSNDQELKSLIFS
jgi:hypothetical protein